MVASRLTLIDNMDKFLRIVLTRRGSWGDGLSTISSALTVLARVSEGNADEVTVSVRRRVYKALATSISCHGTRDGGMERLDDVLAFVLRGMTDADRGVRLSAGYVPLMTLGLILINGDAGILSDLSAKLMRDKWARGNPLKNCSFACMG